MAQDATAADCRSKRKQQRQFLAAAVPIFVVAVAIYVPSLRGEFVFDDSRAIEENKNSNFRAETVAKAIENVVDMWRKDYWGTLLKDERSHKSFRPISILSFYLNGEACDRINAWFERKNTPLSDPNKMICWHLPNLLFHGINSVLVFMISVIIFRRIGGEEFYAAFSAEFAGLLFAVHPIHVESVANIVSRCELLALFFMLSALLYCLKSNGEKRIHVFGIHFLFVIALCFLSLFSKEQGIAALPIIAAADFFFGKHSAGKTSRKIQRIVEAGHSQKGSDSSWVPTPHKEPNFSGLTIGCGLYHATAGNTDLSSIQTYSNSKNDEDDIDCVGMANGEIPTSIKRFCRVGIIFRLLLFFAITIAFAVFRWQIAGGKPCSDCFPPEINPPSFQENLMTRVMSHAFIHFKSFTIALFPADLCCDWGSRCIQLVESVFDPRNIVTVAFTLLVLLPSICIAMAACLKTLRLQIFAQQSKGIVEGPQTQCASDNGDEVSAAVRQLSSLRVGNAFAFGFAFVTLTFLPASNLFVRVGFTIAERVLYGPSTGLALLVSLGLFYQLQKVGIESSVQGNRIKILLKAVVGVLFVAMALKTSLRSVEWTTSYDLFSSSVLVCPNNARLHTFLGRTLIDTGGKLEEYDLFSNHDEEQTVFVPLLDGDTLDNIHKMQRNSSYLDSGLLDNGLPAWSPFAKHWERRYTYRNASSEFYEWLKNVTRRDHFHRNMSFLVAAEGHFVRSIEIGREAGIDEQSYNDLGRAQAHMKEYLEALKNFEIAIKCNRRYSHPRENVKVCLRHVGTKSMANNYDKRAVYEFQEAKDYLEAEMLWRNALVLLSNRGSLINNLALAIMRQGRYDEAEKMYLHALKKDPSFEGTLPSLERLRRERALAQGIPYEPAHTNKTGQEASAQGGEKNTEG